MACQLKKICHVNAPVDLIEELFERHFSKLKFEDQKQIVLELVEIMIICMTQNRKK